jgi:hypothetical protein
MFTSFSTLWDPIPGALRKTRRQAFRASCPEQFFLWLPEILLTDRRFGFICYRNPEFNERTGTPFNRLHYSKVFGDRVIHRTNRYLTNHVEQDHRDIEQRYRPTCGLKTVAAACFCRLFDEIRAFLRPQSLRNQPLSLARRQDIHQEWFTHLLEVVVTAWIRPGLLSLPDLPS